MDRLEYPQLMKERASRMLLVETIIKRVDVVTALDSVSQAFKTILL